MNGQATEKIEILDLKQDIYLISNQKMYNLYSGSMYTWICITSQVFGLNVGVLNSNETQESKSGKVYVLECWVGMSKIFSFHEWQKAKWKNFFICVHICWLVRRFVSVSEIVMVYWNETKTIVIEWEHSQWIISINGNWNEQRIQTLKTLPKQFICTRYKITMILINICGCLVSNWMEYTLRLQIANCKL